ncbi:hypothetical protein BBH99_07730 [Chryseobacterium contaminans]|uniref:Uncharacterized protein n=1 Tax=Chryseobacterium contaminans TaxID=1423959 RepID=A0A1M7AKD9_9FLAO|nr:hypothetical protein [Chryseobacterium contaminans]OCA78659.1 hypothetical protein BBH99_07730 [Chryseobacterium contaminans]SHL43198.1 hypothetical protein SAMN05444407_10425 [Chryseobacterium contaminans]
MKFLNKGAIIVFFLFYSYSSAQYRNGLKGIYMPQGEQVNLPAEYNFFIDEGRRIAGEVFYQNLQRSSGRDSSFNSLELIFFENRKYDFLNTGFILVPQMNSQLMGKNISTVPVRNNNTWKMAFGTVDFATYNPRNNVTNFLYMVICRNMTNEQVLAHFLNMMDLPANSKISKYVQLIRDINRANKIHIDEKVDEFAPGLLTRLCKDINTQTSGNECTLALYKAYIEDKDENITRQNIDRFFRSLSNMSLQNMTNDYVLPRGDLNIMEKDIKLVLPNEFFYVKKKNDQSDVSFFIEKIEQNLNYDFDKKTYVLKFKVTPHFDSMSSDFKFLGEYYDMLKGKQQVADIEVKKGEINYFEFFLYPDRMEVQVNLTQKENRFNYSYKLKNIFKINKHTP